MQAGSVCLRRDFGIEGGGQGQRIGLEKTSLGVVRGLSGQEMVRGGPQGLDVGAGVGVTGVAAVLLQGGVGYRASSLQDSDSALIVGGQ